jgi:hypothetical protein
MSSQLLECHAAEGDDFLHGIVTDDENLFHHFDPEKKRQNMECHHKRSEKEKATIVSSSGKFVGNVLWDGEGFNLTDFLPKREIIKEA